VASTIINVSFYSWNPLPMELRSTFELPSWPYPDDSGIIPQDVDEYFRKYSIFYYRDSISHKNKLRQGLIATGSENIKLPHPGYYHSCYIDIEMRTFAIVPWWSQCSRQFVLDTEKLTGDRMAWTAFNESRVIKGFNSRMIKSSVTNKTKKPKPIRRERDFF
jgi:hypothetical protein